jgi:hypothetical protein
METEAGPLDVILDPLMAVAGLAAALALRAMVRDWRDAQRKRADPAMITLSNHLGVYRPNQRMADDGTSGI